MRNREAIQLWMGNKAAVAAIGTLHSVMGQCAMAAPPYLRPRFRHRAALPEFGRDWQAKEIYERVVSFTKLYTVRVMFCKRNPNAACTEC